MNKARTTKGYLYYIGLSLCIPSGAIAQTNNALYPKTLRLETMCGLDTSVYGEVAHPQLGKVYYFQSIDGFDLPKAFVELATTDRSRVTNVSNKEESTYPYDFIGVKSPSLMVIKTSLGEETIQGKDQNGETKTIIKPIDSRQIRVANFIEDWELDIDNNQFRKTILGIAPVRVTYEFQRPPALKQTCLLINGQSDSSPKKLIARVKFEVLLFNPFYTKIAAEDLPHSDKNEMLSKYELNDAPFFSSYSRYVLTKFITDRAISRKLKSYDFETNRLIANRDEIKRLLGYEENEVEVRNVRTKKIAKTKIVDHTGTIKSVVFCEEWYYQPATATYSKEVIGIAPVLWDNETDSKTPCFTLWLDEKRMF